MRNVKADAKEIEGNKIFTRINSSITVPLHAFPLHLTVDSSKLFINKTKNHRTEGRFFYLALT